jgi:hypothetical protein
MNQYISSSHPELNPCVNDTGAEHQKIVLHSIIKRKWLIYALPAVIAVYLTGNICV